MAILAIFAIVPPFGASRALKIKPFHKFKPCDLLKLEEIVHFVNFPVFPELRAFRPTGTSKPPEPSPGLHGPPENCGLHVFLDLQLFKPLKPIELLKKLFRSSNLVTIEEQMFQK